MFRMIRSNLLDFTGITAIGAVSLLLSSISSFSGTFQLPSSILNLNTIFLSILIESLPFVLIGVLIAGLIQIFVTEEHIRLWLPKNKYLAVTMSCIIGALFPACECGIVPIVRRLVEKGVPVAAGIGFMLTGPLINPIVIASTYMAFGNDIKMAASRMGMGFLIALIAAFCVSFLFNQNQLKPSLLSASHPHSSPLKSSFLDKFWSMLLHSIDEFFDMGKYLIAGAFLAAFVQTYMSAGSLLNIGGGIASSTLVMMGLAFVLSLCSEADAFIGASFSSIFPETPILGFLIFGPMMDLKNTIMMGSVFSFKFVISVLAIVICTVFTILMLMHSIL
ncbi:permease [Mesobacillus foraminis]|uniref:permease n=1 Tax=Mesobacillus foraminis TaxID=279826 RepID=UPI0039A3591B